MVSESGVIIDTDRIRAAVATSYLNVRSMGIPYEDLHRGHRATTIVEFIAAGNLASTESIETEIRSHTDKA